MSELKKALEESLDNKPAKPELKPEKEEIKLLVVKNGKEDNSKKIIKPGETVKF